MGLFGKLKENFNHGGVKLQLQAPASASMTDATIPVTVNISAAESARTIERVEVSIIAQNNDMAFTNPGSANVSTSSQGERSTVAEAVLAEPFALTPGETKTVQLSITMNQGAALEAQLPEGSGLAQVAGALSKLQSISEHLSGGNYQYFIEASAKIEGVAFGLQRHQPSLAISEPGSPG
jgi:hypothetical protein